MASPLVERLRDAALRCCLDEGSEESEVAAREFLEVLERPLHDLELRDASPLKWLAQCEQVLQQAVELLDPSTSSGLELCEKVGLELPRVVVKFVTLSQACQDHCLSVIEDLAENCSPREMFAAFMEALSVYTAPYTLIFCIPLVQGLSLVFSRLQRGQAQFLQEASSGLLALMRLVAQDEDDDNGDDDEEESAIQDMDGHTTIPLKQVRAAIVDDIVQVAQVVRDTCDAVNVDEHREDSQQRLGMFALQILGIIGEKIARPGREIPPAVMELVELLPFCGLSVFLLLTGDQIEALIETTADDEPGADEVVKTNQKRSEATKGAALTVYWAVCDTQVAEAAEISPGAMKEGLRFTGRKGVVAALAVAASLLAGRVHKRPLAVVPATGLALMGTILELASSLELSLEDEDDDDGLAVILRILPALQGLQNVVVYAPRIETRRQGYAIFKKIIQDVIPETMRLQCLQMLINDCIYPSLVSIYLTCIKDEVARAWPSSCQQQGQTSSSSDTPPTGPHQSATSPFVSEEVLEAIGSVLKPEDGAPDLPAQIDPVQSALNLYRFILIRESSGKTNHTGIMSKEALRKARTEWLLPLRELGGQLKVELRADDETSADMSLAIDSLQSVLHRCLKLNEEALAQL